LSRMTNGEAGSKRPRNRRSRPLGAVRPIPLRPSCAYGFPTVLRSLFDLLFARQLDVGFVDGEIHVDVGGRSYAVAEHLQGLSVRRRVPETVAIVCECIEAVLVALGSPAEPSPPLRFAYKPPLMGLVCCASGKPRLVGTSPACRATDSRQTAYCCLCNTVHRLTLATLMIFCERPAALAQDSAIAADHGTMMRAPRASAQSIRSNVSRIVCRRGAWRRHASASRSTPSAARQ
jgi:hypothetical protein